MNNLFNFNNAKTIKGEQFGYRTAILYLAPAKTSGVADLCEFSNAECRGFCLNTAGYAGVFKNIIESRIKKTRLMIEKPVEFWSRIDREIYNHITLCGRQSRRLKRRLSPCVRINGTSDIYNEEMSALMYRYPEVQFYDYTKSIERVVLWMYGKMPPNYHLTFSFNGEVWGEAKWFLERGVNVAVVFDTKRNASLPDTHHGWKVIDGDDNDLRFLNRPSSDGKGSIIGLRAKGKARGVVGRLDSFIQKGVVS